MSTFKKAVHDDDGGGKLIDVPVEGTKLEETHLL